MKITSKDEISGILTSITLGQKAYVVVPKQSRSETGQLRKTSGWEIREGDVWEARFSIDGRTMISVHQNLIFDYSQTHEKSIVGVPCSNDEARAAAAKGTYTYSLQNDFELGKDAFFVRAEAEQALAAKEKK